MAVSSRLAVAAAGLCLAAWPARAAEDCSKLLPKLEQMKQEAVIDEITREKVESLLNDAAGLCEEGEHDKADVKLANVLELLASDVGERDSGSTR
jgi:hypothetical protein